MFQIMRRKLKESDKDTSSNTSVEEKNKLHLLDVKAKETIKEALQKASQFAKDKKNEEAIAEHNKVLAIDSENSKSNYEIGKLYFKIKDFDNAIKFLEKAEKLAGEGKLCRVLLSKSYKENGSSGYLEYMRRSVELSPKAPKYLSLLALNLASNLSENKDEIIRLFDRLLKVEPENIKYLCQYTGILLKIGLPNKVVKLLKPFESSEEPKELAYYNNYGNALMMQGKYERAEGMFKQAIKIFPDNQPLLLKLADCSNAAEKFEDAASYYGKFLKKNPKDEVNKRFQNISLQRAGIYNSEDARKRFYAVKEFENKKIKFSKEQARVFKELSDKGCAITSFDKLFGKFDKKLWNAAEEFMTGFENSDMVVERARKITACPDFDNDPFFKDTFKPSVINHCAHVGNIPGNNPCIDLIRHPKILDIANSYHQMLSKIRNVNFWVNPPIREKNTEIRKGSQMWHRDQEDERILKCFIYFSDVDETNGATEYVPWSRCAPKKKYSKVSPYPCSSGYPSQSLFDNKIDPDDILSLTGKKATIAFLDTNGFHRGGFVTGDSNRVLMMTTFLRPTSPFVQQNTRLTVDEEFDTKGWSNEALFAIS